MKECSWTIALCCMGQNTAWKPAFPVSVLTPSPVQHPVIQILASSDDSSRACIPFTHVGSGMEILALTYPALAIAGIWGMNQEMESLSLFLTI